MKRIKSVEPITGTPQDYFKENVEEGVEIPDMGVDTESTERTRREK